MFVCILSSKQVTTITLQPSMLISQVCTLYLHLCNYTTNSMYVYLLSYKITNVQVRTHEYDLITLPRVTTPRPFQITLL